LGGCGELSELIHTTDQKLRQPSESLETAIILFQKSKEPRE